MICETGHSGFPGPDGNRRWIVWAHARNHCHVYTRCALRLLVTVVRLTLSATEASTQSPSRGLHRARTHSQKDHAGCRPQPHYDWDHRAECVYASTVLSLQGVFGSRPDIGVACERPSSVFHLSILVLPSRVRIGINGCHWSENHLVVGLLPSSSGWPLPLPFSSASPQAFSS